jgi:DNA polymerase III subunit epsilon
MRQARKTKLMLLFIDSETTGLPDFNKRASDPSQPHMVQLAAMLCEPTGEIREAHNVIIKPDGWTISDEVADIHGIDHELAMRVGIPEACAAELLWQMLKRQTLLVAHNVQFDKFLSRIACRRYGLLSDAEDAWWKAMPQFCTMRETTEICQLPGGRGGFKWPKLEEAHEIIFGEKPVKSHDAMEDLLSCKRLYFYLNPPPATKPAEQKELV